MVKQGRKLYRKLNVLNEICVGKLSNGKSSVSVSMLPIFQIFRMVSSFQMPY